jgi:hydroxymethylbilane synthase
VSSQPIRIGARASKLSLAQTRTLQVRIAASLGVPEAEMESVVVITPITTTGDRVQDRRLMEIGGKALFTKEIEEALLEGRIDCAVHSLKDVPAINPDGLVLAAIPKREDARDAYLSEYFISLDELPIGARLGTASLRRQAQMLHLRPDLEIVMLRGNVDTRLAKLARGEADAILLAASGLNRLGLGHLPRAFIDPIAAPPAPGQGALAVQTRVGDVNAPWALALRDEPTTLCVAAERGALFALEGSCRTAVGAHARLTGTRLSLIVEALTPDGKQRFRREGEVDLPAAQGEDAEAAARSLGLTLGRAVREEGGEALILG